MQGISNSHRAERCSAMFVSVACWPHHHRALGVCCVLSPACRSADADLTLLSKRAPPPHAWRGKVVWIVGASQVGFVCVFVPSTCLPACCRWLQKLQFRRRCRQAALWIHPSVSQPQSSILLRVASQGLGEALARYWAEAGARLILSSRSLDKLEASRRVVGGGCGMCWGVR